jgi:hypothetical protein
MTSLLRPTYTLTLGSQRFTSQALELTVTLDTAPVVDALTAAFPATLAMSAAAGDPVQLELGDGTSEEPVFSGTIEAVQRSFTQTRIRALNAGGALSRFRPASTYEQVTAGEVVRNLCGDGGADAGEIAAGVALAFYAADPSRNAFEHIARVAAWSGAMVRVTAENAVEMRVVKAAAAEVALRFGRELLSLDLGSKAAGLDAFVVAGEAGAGSASAPEAHRPTTDFFGGSRPDGPSVTSSWTSAPALRTARAAATARAANKRAYGASRVGGQLTALLQPGLRPGLAVDIRDLPAPLPQVVLWLRRVRHSIGPRGAVTRADFFRGGSSFSPLGLLGSAASIPSFGG